MLKQILATALALCAVALLSAEATAGGLAVGDRAPKLAVKEYLKGAPVTQFEKGKIYVVEFWATWCGPCREAMPHLTEMAKKNADVTFIGVSVWESGQSGVAPFVERMGDKMDYHVAMDAVPEGAKGEKGAMALTWLQAAEQRGIPVAFIVNRESKIAWIGHPMVMEAPLAQILADKWDMKTEAKKSHETMVAAHKQRVLSEKVEPLFEAKRYAECVAVMDAAVKRDRTLESTVAQRKLTMLQLQGKTDEAAAYLSRLVDGALKDDPNLLNFIVWDMVDPAAKEKPSPAMAAAALKGALRADAIVHSVAYRPMFVALIGDTLAAAYFAAGDRAKAIETQENAIRVAQGTEVETDASLAKHLALYKAAP